MMMLLAAEVCKTDAQYYSDAMIQVAGILIMGLIFWLIFR